MVAAAAAASAGSELLAGEEASDGGESGIGGGEYGLKTVLPFAAPFNTGRPPSLSNPRTRLTGQSASSGSVLGLFRPEPVLSPDFFGFSLIYELC